MSFKAPPPRKPLNTQEQVDASPSGENLPAIVSSGYEPPHWSALPQQKFHFEVLKNGSIIEEIDLASKAYFVIGRLPTCDISLQHASVSRHHAIFQHRDTGEVLLFDLGSTHGTKVNKKTIAKRTYVTLHVGDVLKFGESTRLYLLHGPENMRPQEKVKIDVNAKLARERRQAQGVDGREMSLEKKFQKARELLLKEVEEEVTWGQDLVDHISDDEEEGISWEERDPSTFSERQRTMVERLQARRRKVMNLNHEIEVIQAKENDASLTAGQQAQIDRNRKRIEELQEQIASMEESVQDAFDDADRRKNGGSAKRNKKKIKRKRYDSDEEDDFYDRTTHNKKRQEKRNKKKKVGNSAPLGSGLEASLTQAEINKLLEEKTALKKNLEEDLERRHKVVKAQKQEGDVLDMFMSEVATTMKDEAMTKIKDKIDEASKDIIELRQTLNRRIRFDRLEEIKAGKQPTIQVTSEPAAKQATSTVPKPHTAQSAGGLASILERAKKKMDKFKKDSERAAKQVPKLAPSVQQQPQMQAAPNPAPSSTSVDINIGSHISTTDLAALIKASSEKSITLSGSRKGKKSKNTTTMPQSGNSAQQERLKAAEAMVDDTNSTWVPPSNQSGDGTTSLNAKYGY